MADSTLNRFLASGTTAERTAFTPTPPTPSSGPDFGYAWYDTDDGLLYSWDGSAWQAPAGTGTVTNTGTLTADTVIVGNGGTDVKALAIGSAGDVLQVNAGGTAVEFAAPSGGGGNSIDSTAFGSEPGTPSTGDLDLYSNSFYASRYSGSAWVPWGPIFPMVDPALASLSTWVNQGSATIVTTPGGIYLRSPSAFGDNLHAYIKTAPSTPYTITIAFLPQITNANFLGAGFVWRQASDGKIVTAGVSNTTDFVSSKWNSATSFNSDYSMLGGLLARDLVWMRLADNGTDRIISVSRDGQNWEQIHSVGRTDFLTADQVGIFVNTNNGTATNLSAMTLLSWKES